MTTFTLTDEQLEVALRAHRDDARVLLAIAAGARNHLEITRRTNVPHPAVLPALRILNNAGLIRWTKEEGWLLNP